MRLHDHFFFIEFAFRYFLHLRFRIISELSFQYDFIAVLCFLRKDSYKWSNYHFDRQLICLFRLFKKMFVLIYR